MTEMAESGAVKLEYEEPLGKETSLLQDKGKIQGVCQEQPRRKSDTVIHLLGFLLHCYETSLH